MAVVLVTGCSTGIGRATALELARQGHRVHASMRNPSRGEALRSAADAEGLDVTICVLDVTDDRSVREAVAAVVSAEGRLDAVVNNAGVGPFGAVEHTTDEEWAATFDTNVIGAVRVIRAALPHFRAQGGGTVVNVSSVAGRLASLPTHGAYSASKHAMCALADAVAAETQQFGVRVWCVEPGFFATDILDNGSFPELPEGDPYRDVQEGIAGFFREAVASAPPPDAVAALIATAVGGGLSGGVHHVVGADGPPTATSQRLVP